MKKIEAVLKVSNDTFNLIDAAATIADDPSDFCAATTVMRAALMHARSNGHSDAFLMQECANFLCQMVEEDLADEMSEAVSLAAPTATH